MKQPLDRRRARFEGGPAHALAMIVLALAASLSGRLALAQADCNANGVADDIDLRPTNFGFPQWPPTLATGQQPLSVKAGDLDGDQDLDLAVANSGSDDVSVLLNQGGGTFAAAVNYPAGNSPHSVTVGDLDGDQDLDLAVVGEEYFGFPYNVSVLLNQGGGTFAAGVNYSVGNYPRSVTVGDLDGDQDLDLAVTIGFRDGVPQGISVLLNEGSGTFAAAVNYPAGDSHSVTAGDLDGDQDLDLAMTNTPPGPDDVVVLLNEGSGTFAAPVNYAAGVELSSVIAGDLDGDLDLDLALTSSGNVSVLLNQGSGTFADLVMYRAGGARRLTAGDLDGDQDLDLAVTRRSDVLEFLNNVTPPVSRDCNRNTVPDECDLAAGTSADCNADGLPDDCQLAGNDCNGNGALDSCDIAGGGSTDDNANGIPDDCEQTFIRGDCNGDGQVSGVVTDAVFMLNFNFLGGPRPPCIAACDASGDGQFSGTVTDAVYLLNFNFLGGPPPAAPFPDCDAFPGCENRCG